MLTIMEAMELPALQGTKLIAGAKGKERAIKWVTTIEIIEDITRFQEGEFLITTGFGLMDNPSLKNNLLQLIQLSILSGIAIYKGFYVEKIPEEIIDEANKQNLPLIEIPTSINFSTITKAIVEQIGNKQMGLLEDSLNIHKEMTKLALSNKGLNEVLVKLSPLTDSSLCVFDDIGNLLAIQNSHTSVLEIDEEFIYLQEKKYELSNLYSEMATHGTSRVFDWDSYYCFMSPIEADSFTYGYLLAILEAQVWTEMDDIIMDHVATLIGIELVKQYAIEETRVRLQGELVEEILLKNQLSKETALKRGKKLGFDLTRPHSVVFLKIIQNSNSDRTNQLHYVVTQLLGGSNRQFILLPKVNELYALLEVNMAEKMEEREKLKALMKKIQNRWSRHYKEAVMIGIGSPYEDIDEVAISAKEAEYAVRYAPLLLNESNIIHFEELGFYQLFIRMQESGISLHVFYETYLGNLIQQKPHRTDLILTLETYLAHNCNIQQTAAHLYIHRHTLKYRLSQIEKRTGLNLQSPDDRMNLHLAILAYKFVALQKEKNGASPI